MVAVAADPQPPWAFSIIGANFAAGALPMLVILALMREVDGQRTGYRLLTAGEGGHEQEARAGLVPAS